MEEVRDELLTVDEAGDIIRGKRNLVYDLINSGELMSIKIGHCRRIPRSEVDRFIARKIKQAMDERGLNENRS